MKKLNKAKMRTTDERKKIINKNSKNEDKEDIKQKQ